MRYVYLAGCPRYSMYRKTFSREGGIGKPNILSNEAKVELSGSLRTAQNASGVESIRQSRDTICRGMGSLLSLSLLTCNCKSERNLQSWGDENVENFAIVILLSMKSQDENWHFLPSLERLRIRYGRQWCSRHRLKLARDLDVRTSSRCCLTVR